MAIPENIADNVLSKSARRCCLCRQFVPLVIQVHHIIERSEGGTDDIENLIALCASCHATVHAKTRMTRAISAKELKSHRDQVYKLVEDGKLPEQTHLTTDAVKEIATVVAAAMQNPAQTREVLSEHAARVLISAVCEGEDIRVETIQGSEEKYLRVAGHSFFLNKGTKVDNTNTIPELIKYGYVSVNENVLKITKEGERFVRSAVGTTAKYTRKKIKCMMCSLHFVICTWEPDLHTSKNIHCPECGQKGEGFVVWAEQVFGFIFQEVPGHAGLYDMHIPSSNE